MERFYFSVAILIGVFCLAGCRSETNEPSRAFYTNFSIAKIVEQNDEFILDGPTETNGELQPGSRTLTGMEAGPPEPFVQRYEETMIQVDEFDQSDFMLALKTDIERAISESGTKVQGYGQAGGPDSEYFSYDYFYDQVYGTIHIWAVMGSGANMTIIALLTED